jgi:hypothetical protein
MDPNLAAEKLSEIPKWLTSRFGNVENYIKNTLSEEERAWLKLRNPIGIAEHLLNKYLTVSLLFVRAPREIDLFFLFR